MYNVRVRIRFPHKEVKVMAKGKNAKKEVKKPKKGAKKPAKKK